MGQPTQTKMLQIIAAIEPGRHLEQVKALFQEYNTYIGINLDFQNFDAELAQLPGKFGPPDGRLYLALWNGQPIGCAAFYKFSDGICELKRLYVKEEFHGQGVGRELMQHAIDDAKQLGYRHMRLDSLKRLTNAEKLYDKMGFSFIAPYNHNPHDDVYYMERAL